MTIDRVSTAAQAQYLLTQINKASNALNTSQDQVASGLASTNYTGIGDKTAALEAARTAADRATAYQNNTQLAVTQADLQDSQLTQLSSLAEQLKEAVETAAGNGDGTGLMETAQSVFQQASQILNSQDSNGNYIYGGDKDNTPPFTAASLSDLVSDPDVSDFFANGSQKKTVMVGDGQPVTVGVLASDVGTSLMQALQSLASLDNPPGSYGGQLTSDQIDALTDPTTGVLPEATQATQDLNSATAANGDVYNQLNDAVTSQQSLSTLYQGFVSDIQNVDMGQAITNLNQNQTALQAALQVTAQLNSLSLLNYLPNS